MPGNNSVLKLDINGLYILLTQQSVDNKWHWGLYLRRGVSKGWIFQSRRLPATGCTTVIYSERIVVALKVAVIPPDMHQPLRGRLGVRQAGVKMEYTERFGPITCRTWLLRALQELDDEGYISIKPGYSVEDIKEEAKDAASDIMATAMSANTRISMLERVFRSDYSRA